MRALILAAAIALTPLASTAGEPRDTSTLTAADYAAGRAEGDRIISDAAVSDMFENETATGGIHLRHVPSGMICSFVGGGEKAILVDPNAERGAQVRCVSHPEGMTQVLQISRVDPALTRDAALDETVADIQRGLSEIKRYPPMTSQTDGGDPSLEPKYASFAARRGRTKVFTVVGVAKRGNWLFQISIVAPASMDLVAQLQAGELGWGLAQIDQAH